MALPTCSAWGCQAVPEPLVYVQYVKFAMEFKPPFLEELAVLTFGNEFD